MKSSKLRRALAVFLSAAMLILAVPFTGITAAAEDGWTEVSDADELLAALAGTGNIRFTSDISMEELSVNRSCVIDLDNHTLTITHGSVSTNAREGLTIDTADPVTFKNGTILISPGGKQVAMVINKTKSILTLEKIHLKGNTSNCGLLATNSGVRSEKITFINSTIENTTNSWTARSVFANSSTFYFKGDVNFISINKEAYSILGPGVTTINIYGNVTTNTWFRTCNYENSTLNFYGGSIKTTGTGGKLFEYTKLALGDADKMKLYSDSGKTTPINDVTTLGTSVSAAYSTYDHTHNWTYSANENVITATCGAGGCPISPSPKLTLKANDVEYTGRAYAGAQIEKDSDFPGTAGNITYSGTLADGITSYPNSETAPTVAGTYTASVTVNETTASANFRIKPFELTENNVSLSAENYDYEEGITREPTVTVKATVNGSEVTLTKDVDYTISGVTSASDASTGDGHRIIVRGKGNFSGTVYKYWKINKIDYDGNKTEAGNILAGVATSNATVALPAIPENMSYGEPLFATPITAASISGSTLTFSTDNSAENGQKYTITIPVISGGNANYNPYEITVTLSAQNCEHTDTEGTWSFNENGHWHKCSICSSQVNYAEHTFGEWVTVTEATSEEEGLRERECSVCHNKETDIIPKLDTPVEPEEPEEPEHTHSFGEWFVYSEATVDEEGLLMRVCSCGEKEFKTIPKLTQITDDPDNGNIYDKTPVTNVGKAVFDNVMNVVLNIDITPEESLAMANGEDMNIFLEVKDASETAPKEDVEKVNEAVSENGIKLGMILDISLFKQIGNNPTIAITETKEPITITFKMPEALINSDGAVDRTYYIIRVHDGKTEIIYGTYNAETNEFTFETDKFSTYAIAYSDKAKNTSAPTYPVDLGNDSRVHADKTKAAAGEKVTLSVASGCKALVISGGDVIATITGTGSFIMPKGGVIVKVTAIYDPVLMGVYKNSYVYSYDSDMNYITVNRTKKQGTVTVDLGKKYAGKSFVIYTGKKSTSVKVTEGTLDKNGKFTLEIDYGKNYTLVVED